MLLRKTAWFWKSGLAVISFVLMFSISGCSDTPPEEDTVSETVIDVQDVSEEEQENEEEIINICIDTLCLYITSYCTCTLTSVLLIAENSVKVHFSSSGTQFLTDIL